MQLNLTLKDQQLILDSKKAIFWNEKKILILSDLHLGKAGHFRKNGFPLPQEGIIEDLNNLTHLVNIYKPNIMLIVGDLFHSTINKEWELFTKWRKTFSNLDIKLIKGNHDINYTDFFKEIKIDCFTSLNIDPFLFIHEASKVEETNKDFIFSGHLHPAVKLRGGAKDYVRLPCFYFTDKLAVLPAFGKLTGLYEIKPKQNDKIFIIFENSIRKLL